MPQIETLIFDFDGTLADTSQTIVATITETLRDSNFPILPEREIKALIGLSLQDMFVKATNVSEKGSIDALCQLYREKFGDIADHTISLFSGVKSTLEMFSMAGYHIAIATSRSHASLDFLCEKLGIGELIEIAYAEDDVVNKKPAPDMVLAILERLGVKPESALVVGDTTFDISMGRAAGCRTCAVTYGNHTEAQLENAMPDYIVDSFPTLLAILSE